MCRINRELASIDSLQTAVNRFADLTGSLGIDADVTPAPTAWYFLPGAFLRELLAALTLHPRTNLAGLGVWAAGTAYLAYAVPLR